MTQTASKLTKNQKQNFITFYNENGQSYKIIATVRYGDECGNGHNSFSITGSIYEKYRNGRWRVEPVTCGCIHEDIAKHFPALAPYIKWHLFSSDGPMHYIANTVYHAEEGKYDYARSCAIWPDATDFELSQSKEDLEGMLLARLPNLMTEFKIAIESLGFEY